MKEKKSIFKKWWFWVGLVAIVGLIGAASSNSTTNASSSNTQHTSQAGITKANFDKIDIDMTKDRVDAILGTKGSIMSQTADGEDVSYEDGMQIIQVLYMHGKVYSKAQTGLQ